MNLASLSSLLRNRAVFSARGCLIRAINVADAAPERHVSAINVAQGPAGWSIIKYGIYPNRVGLQVFDREAAEAIFKTFNSRLSQFANAFRGEPIYVGHPDDPEWAKANPGIRAEAVGRIREMKVEADGLHLRTAYNVQGERLVKGEAPAYEAFSPNWGMLPITYQGRKAFRPVELYSIGLTNQPNIPGSFIGLNEALPPEPNSVMKKHIIALLAALGRPVADAAAVTDAQLESAVNEAVPVATKLVGDQASLVTATNETTTVKGQLTAAQAQVQTAVNEAATLRTALAAERAARAGLVITGAINEGRITEAQRPEWLGKFTADKSDFAAVETELNKLQKAVNTKSKTEGIGARRGATGDQSKVRGINEAVTAYKKDHPGATHDDAFAAVRADKPELFTNDKGE